MRTVFLAPFSVVRMVTSFVFSPFLGLLVYGPAQRLREDLQRALREGGTFALVRHHRSVLDDDFVCVWADFRNDLLTGSLTLAIHADHSEYSLTVRVKGHKRDVTVYYLAGRPDHMRFGLGRFIDISHDYSSPFDELKRRAEGVLPPGFWEGPNDVE